MSLAALIRARIAAQGPMPLAEYMGLCLGHPEHGYYMTRDPLGRAGDFVTAPEISQMFGELLALALAAAWEGLGRPAPCLLAELGPGRGTLMADMLRTARSVPGFRAALRPVLVETSPVLRATQAARLAGEGAEWAERAADLPDLPLLLVANEFLDALPVRQYLRTPAGWAERVVEAGADGGLRFGLAPPAPLAGAPDLPAGIVIERRPEAEAIAAGLGARLARRGGLALVIDYGAEAGTGDTFQAVRGHRYADPLAEPGAADLTAHVDFGALARAARAAGAAAHGPVPQGRFLEALGLGLRAAALARRAPERAEEIAAARARLAHPAAMGRLFRVLALTGPDAPLPPGFGDGP